MRIDSRARRRCTRHGPYLETRTMTSTAPLRDCSHDIYHSKAWQLHVEHGKEGGGFGVHRARVPSPLPVSGDSDDDGSDDGNDDDDDDDDDG